MIVDEETYLEHFGVKGMQWGVRNEKKTSYKKGEKLGIKDRFSARQTRIKTGKAVIFENRAKHANVRISELNKELASLPSGAKNYMKSRNLKAQINIGTNARDENLKQAKKIRESRLTPAQKKVLIGAGIVGTILAAGYLSKNSEKIGANIRRIKSEKEHGDIFKVDKSLADKSLDADQVLEKVAKTVNPNYASLGGKMNCRRSTFAYELRRRGYNVEATPSVIGRGQSETGLVNALISGDKNVQSESSLSRMIVDKGRIQARPTSNDFRVNTKTVSIGDLSLLKRSLSNQPNGARGEIVFNEESFGHSMAWEVIKGKAYIFDSQKGTRYDVSGTGLSDIVNKWGHPKEMALTRLDNVDLDLGFIGQWVKNSSSPTIDPWVNSSSSVPKASTYGKFAKEAFRKAGEKV